MSESPSRDLLDEARPKIDACVEAFKAMADALLPAVKGIVHMIEKVLPDARRLRRAQMRQLRSDFIRKRGMRR